MRTNAILTQSPRLSSQGRPLSRESVLACITDNPKLPTPPTVAIRVLERASTPHCTLQEIGRIISYDPGLCGKMLKLVNSTLFGLQRPVASIDRALNLLGLNHVRSLVLSLSLPSLRFRRSSSDQLRRYWKTSVTTAMVCREIAVRRQFSDPDSEMVAGLLCDLGVLILQESFPEKYAPVAAQSPDVLLQSQCELERNSVGVDHAEAGAYFLQRWKLPTELTGAIRYHHVPATAPAETADRAYLLYFATRITQMQCVQMPSLLVAEIVSLAHQRFGLTDEQLQDFLDTLHQKIDEFARLIDMDLGPTESFSALFATATNHLTKLAVEASLDNFRVQEEKSQVEAGLKLAKAALHKSEEQLRQAQKMEAIGRFAGGIAHDFNNLLTVMIGNCELLLENPSLDCEATELVELVKQTSQRAADLTRQLLAFSRKQKLAPEIVSLNAVLSEMSKLLERLIGENVKLVARLADNLPMVLVDPSQLEQVILNLAVNARDAMPSGGTLTIETFLLNLAERPEAKAPEIPSGDYVVMAVHDTGHGMDETTLQRIFEPFFTTKEKGQGTGLGLATVHGVIQQSGGHITVSSRVGEGTIFHIYLPCFVKEKSKTQEALTGML